MKYYQVFSNSLEFFLNIGLFKSTLSLLIISMHLNRIILGFSKVGHSLDLEHLVKQSTDKVPYIQGLLYV